MSVDIARAILKRTPKKKKNTQHCFPILCRYMCTPFSERDIVSIKVRSYKVIGSILSGTRHANLRIIKKLQIDIFRNVLIIFTMKLNINR